MSSLLVSLRTSAEAMRAFEKALAVVQNNVSNASTPGYARQLLPLEAMRFAPDMGFPGGVEAGQPRSTRDEFADAMVRSRLESYGFAEECEAQLGQLEPVFDISSDTGIPSVLSQLFQSFSAWSQMPNDSVARGLVIERATDTVRRFNEASEALTDARVRTSQQVRDTVATINSLAGTVRDLNASFGQDVRNRDDASLDAKLTDTLEKLAGYVDFTALREPDGTVTVLAGGQTPLVIGDRQYQLAADTSEEQAIIRDAAGKDVTAQMRRGRLAALVEMNNTTIPSFASSLDRLAAGLSDRVNAILASGADPTDPTSPGAPLFTYDAANGAAATLAVSGGIQPELLAAGTPAAPAGNATAMQLANLQNSQEIDGASFLAFYGTVAQRMGESLNAAREDRGTEERMVQQARSLRSESSGVSLDQEAEMLIEYQRAYQASARVLTVLNDLTDTLINLIH